MAALRKGAVYVGIKGHVVALDTGTGTELWRTKLKGADMVTVNQDGGRIYAATKGEVFALEPHGGDVLWVAKLKGLGMGLVSILTGQGTTGFEAAAKKVEAQQAAAAAAAS